MNLRDKFLTIADLPVKVVDVPGWGPVHLRTLSAAEADYLVSTDETGARLCALVATLAVSDEDGEKVFSNKDVEALTAKSPRALRAIFDAVLEMGKVTEETVGEAEKKSDPTS